MKISIKKIFAFSFILLFILVQSVFSASNTKKIIEKFKEKQEEIIFDSEIELSDYSNEDLYKISNKIWLFNNIKNKLQAQREDIEKKSSSLELNINSLENSIYALDQDIEYLENWIKKINSQILESESDINTKKQRINYLNKIILNNKKIIIDYIIYLYKKWNLVSSGKYWNIDNIKSILMTDSAMDELLNDLYFKNLIGIAWKNLIDNHKKNIWKLYIEKVSLEQVLKKQEKLKKDILVKQKLVIEKKEYKNLLLSLSKKKNFEYKKYISDKIKLEKNLSIKLFKEKKQFFNISKEALLKEWCKLISNLDNIPKWESSKCIELNKLLYAESQLKWFTNSWPNKFEWPVLPMNWISSYYHDTWYYDLFGVEHDAIDIVVDQWTPVIAPADWYVLYFNPPTWSDYSFLVIKHPDGFISVYWHLSEILVEKYDYVKQGTIIAKSWWEIWTKWAWIMTTWAHLHFEIYYNKIIMDPLTYLNISLLNFDSLPQKYKYKYKEDYKERTWEEYNFSDKQNKETKIFKISWKTELERQKSLLSNYARSDFTNLDIWIEEALDWRIDPSFMICIWLAESSLWNSLKTSYNIWNIWNTDSWETRPFSSPRDWIHWIWRTLNNKYLRQYNTINMLSRYWNRKASNPIYASSPYNWHNNIIKCLSSIKWKYIPDDFRFRVK